MKCSIPLCFCFVLCANPLFGTDPIVIGSRREPFIDDYLVERLEGGATFDIKQLVPREVVLVHDDRGQTEDGRLSRPWEGNTCGYHSVFQDGDHFKMYYRASDWTKRRGYQTHEVACMATSRDGIHWERPILRLYAFEYNRGRFKGDTEKTADMEDPKENNIVWPHSLEAASWISFKDPNPNCLADERYKTVGGMDKVGMMGLTSPDGIHWSRIEKSLIPDDVSSDWNFTLFWWPKTQRYHSILRYWQGGDGSHRVHHGYRSLRWMGGDSFTQWDPYEAVIYDTDNQLMKDLLVEPDEHCQLYTGNVMPYVGAPHLLIGFPMRFTPTRKKEPSHPYPGLTDIGLLTSRDGKRFQLWGDSISRPRPYSTHEGDWTQRTRNPTVGMIQTSPEEISIYWNENTFSHFPEVKKGAAGCQVRRATIRTDGFVSIRMPFSGGGFTTKPFRFDGKRLQLNYETSVVGEIKIEIQNADGRPIPGYTLEDARDLFGNSVAEVCQWKGGEDLSKLSGMPIRLRMVGRDADVYSIQFTD